MAARCLRCGLTADLHRGFCGYCLKDKGIKAVLARESSHWKQGALEAIRTTATTRKTFTADHVKDTADAMKLPKPHHFNCWGGIFRTALTQGYMHDTGKSVSSTRAKQHGTKVVVYTTERVQTEAEKWKAIAEEGKRRWHKERKRRRRAEAKLRRKTT